MATRKQRHAARRAAGWVLCGYTVQIRMPPDKWTTLFASDGTPLLASHKTSACQAANVEREVWPDETHRVASVWRRTPAVKAALAKLASARHFHHGEPCRSEECQLCGVLDCPHNEPLHYHHDGCPACTEDMKR